ncbi:MAG TPA: branched-chain amino acid ABC transporter permease [Burkholderiaceae bacterium]
MPVYQVADAFAFLVLASLGLAVIFGMMGVINLAHGELIMCGAYVTVTAARSGLPLWLAMACGALAAGAVGMVAERLFIRRLYGRPFDSIVATWALSLIGSQGTLILVGPSLAGLGTPLGSVTLGGTSFAAYRFVLIAIALALLLGLYLLFMHTGFGRKSRATMQNAQMARALGTPTDRLHTLTFGLGSALAGLTGALYAPTMVMIPTMGATFIVQAFVTVVVGGANVLLGVAPAALALGSIQAALTGVWGNTIGQLGLLVAAMVVIRCLPGGFSELRWRRRHG